MNLEKLISKYLDGELSLEEDQYLRSLVANNSEAKALFEEHIELSYSLKKDSEEISTPKDLKDSVEDKILMRIMSETQFNDIPDYVGEKQPSIKKEEKKRRALIFLPIFLLGIVSFALYNSIGNKQYDSYVAEMDLQAIKLDKFEPYIFLEEGNASFNDLELNENNDNGLNSDQKIELTSNNSKITNQISNSNIEYSDSKLLSSDNVSKLKQEKLSRKIKVVIPSINSRQALSNSISNNDISNSSYGNSGFTSPSAAFNPNFLVDPAFNGRISDKDITPFKGKFEFSSVAGSEMMQGGYSPNNMESINNFAQSIAFRFSDNQKVGFEVGFNEYTFSSMRRATIPFPDLNGYEMDPSRGDIYTRNGISTLVTSDQIYRNYWAVIFAEKKLVEYYKFDFSGRVGFGATNSGPLAYGRLLGNYHIFDNISLTAGMDFRMFQSNLSAFVDQSNGFKGNVSFVYGLNINF